MRHSLLIAVCLAFTLVAQAEVKPTAPPEPAGMTKLFDGKDLADWEGDTRLWSVKDGAIRGETTPEKQTKGNTFLMYKGGEFADFELRLAFRIDHGNAGVQYRSKHVPNRTDNAWVVSGYQYEVANSPTAAGFLYHERGRASLCKVGEKVEVGEDGKPKVVGSLGDAKEIGASYQKSGWNELVIIAKGNRLQHFVNGVQTVDCTDNDPKGRLMSGILALQIHAGPPMWVEYKDVRIKKL